MCGTSRARIQPDTRILPTILHASQIAVSMGSRSDLSVGGEHIVAEDIPFILGEDLVEGLSWLGVVVTSLNEDTDVSKHLSCGVRILDPQLLSPDISLLSKPTLF